MGIKEASSLVFPSYFPKPVYDFSQYRISESKIELGRTLFYDPILSKDLSVSCASCHSSFNAFAHVDHTLSHGINDQIGTRNAPSLINLAWQKSFMWDGAIHHLDVQALAPIHSPIEMGDTLPNVLNKLRASKRYQDLFRKAYQDTEITGERFLKAITQFQLSLVSASAKYDSVMQGKAVFTAQEENGFLLHKKHCQSCHPAPLFSTFEFANNGLLEDRTLRDEGRMKVTQNVQDAYKFKIPTLRNLSYSLPYMHDGRFKRLRDVLNHYTQNINPSATLAPQLQKPVVLSENEKVDLIAFLLTLNDRDFILNPKFRIPKSLY